MKLKRVLKTGSMYVFIPILIPIIIGLAFIVMTLPILIGILIYHLLLEQLPQYSEANIFLLSTLITLPIAIIYYGILFYRETDKYV